MLRFLGGINLGSCGSLQGIADHVTNVTEGSSQSTRNVVFVITMQFKCIMGIFLLINKSTELFSYKAHPDYMASPRVGSDVSSSCRVCLHYVGSLYWCNIYIQYSIVKYTSINKENNYLMNMLPIDVYQANVKGAMVLARMSGSYFLGGSRKFCCVCVWWAWGGININQTLSL